MSLRRFSELWEKSEFKFECSPHLSHALIRAANGDHRDFDEIERILANAEMSHANPKKDKL